MTIWVSRIEPQGSVALGFGKTEDGQDVVFAGDWRPMRDLAEAIEEAGEPQPAEIEGWQVI